jgi:hypothetical protein
MNFIFFIYLICAFNPFFLTPLSLFSDLILQLFALLGIITVLKERYVLKKFYSLLILTLVSLIISSIASSMINLRQDFYSSIIATQHLFKVFSIFFFLPLLKKDKVEVKLKWLISFVWIFALYIAFVSIIDWSFVFISSLSGNELIVTAAKYEKAIIFFGIIYYLVGFFEKGSLQQLFYALVLFSCTQIYDIQRGDYIFVAFMFFILGVYFRKYKGVKIIIFITPLVLAIFIAVFSFIDLSTFNDKFGQLFLLFEGKEANQIQDASVFIRIEETEFALEGFYEHPFFGNGLMRNSQKEALIGDVYFYPSDVGLFGLLYTFGLFGLLVFISLLVFTIRAFKTKFIGVSSIFLMYLLYIIVYSVKDGNAIFFPSMTVICIVFISLKVVKTSTFS